MRTFMELARDRYSVRKFDGRKIEKEKLDKIIEAGQIAPTGANLQPQRIYILQSEDALAKLKELKCTTFGAGMVLLFAYDSMPELIPEEKRVNLGVEDVSIVATHMMLEAWELGIGTCWTNGFSAAQVKEAFSLPENEEVVLLMPIGYPAPDARPLKIWHDTFKPIEEVVTYL